MKRSSCASGSGYVPSYSIGFWVATTMNGAIEHMPLSFEVDLLLFHRLQQRGLGLGGARLISSARSSCVKIGPFFRWKRVVETSNTLVPRISDGIRSGVNWMRVNFACTMCASVFAINVLAVPGTPSNRTCPPVNNATARSSNGSSNPTRTLLASVRNPSKIVLRSVGFINSPYLEYGQLAAGICSSKLFGSID